MAFPTDPLDVTVQLQAGGTWTDITTDTLARDTDAVSIQRGRMAEGSRSIPTVCGLSLRNTGGTYSPRNPSSSLYGLIGRNTPLRVYTGTPHLGAGGGTGTASTSHIAPSVTATGAGLLVCGWMSDDPVNYTLPVGMTAGPTETDGTYSTMRTGSQSVASAGATGTRTATASASQGYASVSALVHGSVTVEQQLSDRSTSIDDVTLTTSSSTQAGWWLVAVQGWDRGFDVPMPDAPYGDDGGWILLADSTTITGTNSAVGGQTVYMRMRAWARRVNYDGAQAVIFPGIAEADTSNADNHAALFVLSGVTGWNIRATVEVPSWPQRWDVTGTDVWVPVECQGVLRRLSQGESPLRSPLRRAITGAGPTVWVGESLLPVAYWPIEDGSDSSQAASGLTSGPPMLPDGTIVYASVPSPGSSDLPDWSQASGALIGPVSGITSGSDWLVGCLLDYTGGGAWTCLSVYMSDAPYAELQLVVGSTVALNGLDYLGASTALVSSSTDLSDDEPHWVQIIADAGGGGVTYRLAVDGSILGSSFVFGSSGAPTQVKARRRTTTGAAGLGHVGVWSGYDTASYLAAIKPAVTGHDGEVAGRRVERLCHEEGIAVHIVGDPDATAPMGRQTPQTLLALLRECEDADGGVLYEPREAIGIGFRCASSLSNQPVTLALTYGAAGEVGLPLEPVDDDRNTRNDVTAARPDGSSARYEVAAGALSTADPPDGVGRYDTSVTVNVQSDSQLLDQAGWRAHLGTWDEPRYPTLRVDLARLGKEAKTALSAAAAAVDVGDRVTVDDPPVWLPPGPIDQHVEGYTETLSQYVWDVRLVCAPAGPWQVATVDGDGRVGADGSTLAAAVTSTATSLLLASTVGNGPWTTAAADFPQDLRVGGERVTVSGIASAVTDAFGRSTSSGWGTADSGQSWTVDGTASAYSTTGSLGRMATSTTGTLYLAHVDTTVTDHEVRGSVTVPVVPSGAGISARVAGRLADASNYYEAQILIATTGATTLQIFRRVAGVGASVSSSVSVGTHSAGTTWSLAFNLAGSTLRAKAWKSTDPVPADWQVTGTDTSLTAGTRVGCLVRRETGNTNGATNIDWDNVSVPNPQTVTVSARSVNGVVRAWDAGTTVDVWQTAVVAL